MDGAEEGQWDDRKWEARKILECSLPIKCPSIDVHLAGFKKYQQSFAEESVLRGISGNDQTTEELKNLFTGIWSLENLGEPDAEVNEVVERAL